MSIGFRRTILTAVAAVGLGLVGVSGSLAQEGDASVTVVHASPDAPAVDVWVNGAVAIPGLEFGQQVTTALPAGSYDIAVAPAGAPATDAVIEATVELAAGSSQIVAAVGFLDEIQAQIYSQDRSALAEGDARVQFIHASPDAPAVDVLVNGADAALALTFPDTTGYLTVPAGSYDVDVRVNGTDTIALSVPGVVLEASKVYDVLVIGEAGDGSLAPLVVVSDSAAAVGGTADAAVTTAPSTGVGMLDTNGSNVMVLTALGILLVVAAFATRNFVPVVNKR